MEISTPDVSSHPATGPWWPSPWGPDDRQGATNRVTTSTVMRAASWIKRGEHGDMDHVKPLFITATVADLAAYRGAPLEPGETYPIEDIRGALAH